MRVHPIAATAVLILMVAPASAIDPAELERAAALFDTYAPAEPDIALDELLGPSGFDAAPDPALIENLAPDVVLRAEADNPGADDFGDDFGGGGASGAATSDDAQPQDNAPATTPVAATEPAAGAVAVAPVVPEGWTRHDKLGIGFAAPPDYALKVDGDDEFVVTNSDMKTPKGCAVMGRFDDEADPTSDAPSGAVVEKLPERDLGYGVTFTITRLNVEDDGIDFKALVVLSKQPFNEDEDYFQFIISCANEPADSAQALIDGVLGSLHLTKEPVLPVPEAEKPRLGGLVTGAMPDGWAEYRSNSREWIIFAPAMQAAVNFRLGYDALSALKDLAPDRRFREFAVDPAPVIEHVTMMGTEGWLVSGRIAPDDPEHGVYNGGMEGPNIYFFTDRCTLDGDALVVSMSAQQSWIDKGNSFDFLRDAIAVHWPDGEAKCADDVAKAMAAATGAALPPAAPAPSEADVEAQAPVEAPAVVPLDGPVANAGSEGNWSTYVDPRFGTSVSYPADIFVVTSDASDGKGIQVATADDAAELMIGGIQLDGPVVIDDLMREMLLSPDFDTLTGMDRVSDSSFRLDGVKDGQQVIQIIAASDGNILNVFGARYSEAYADIVGRVADSFRVVATQPAQPAQASGTTDPAIELAFWDAIKDSSDPADFKAYLDQFPTGVFASLARIRIARLSGGAAQPVTPAPVAAPIAGPRGTFESSGFGTIRFASGADGAVVADYTSGKGQIDGRLNGTSLVGRWVQPTSNKRCADGTYWGGLQFEFSADFTSFTGTWAYCDAKLGNPNTKGTRTGDGLPDVSLPASTTTFAPASPTGPNYAGPHQWQTYANDRFGTVIDYPADLFSPLPPPTNNDGRRFTTSDDRAGFYVFGQFNALGDSLQALYSADLAASVDEQVTYKKLQSGAQGGGWFVVSGYRGADIFYRKTLLTADDVLHRFEVRYRRDLKQAFDPIVARMTKSFAAGFSEVAAPSSAPASAAGLWEINANGYKGQLRLAYGPDGLSGYVNLSGHDEILRDVQYDPSRGQVAFLRPLGPQTDQHYVGTVAGNRIDGKFNQGAGSAYSYNWSAILLEADGFVPQDMGAGQGATAPVSQPATAFGPFVTPGRGSDERRMIMDAARGPIATDIGQSVIFIVDILRSDGHWAYLQARPVQPNGKPIDWATTRYAADWQADAMSDTVMVLLSTDGGAWHTVDHIVGPTDVYWYGWIDQYQLPEALFRE